MNYLEKIKTLYQLENIDFQGFSAEEIAQAEQRLNVYFPEKLKEYYRLLGKNKTLNKTYNWLLSPSEMDFADDFLMFYEEYQQVCFWTIKKEDLQKDCIFPMKKRNFDVFTKNFKRNPYLAPLFHPQKNK